MIAVNEKLKEKIKESLSSVLPITIIVLLLSITLVPMEIGTLALFLTGAVLLIVGMGLFQLGAEMAMTPLGQGVGGRLMKGKHIVLIALVRFFSGVGKSGCLYSQSSAHLDSCSGRRRFSCTGCSPCSVPYQPFKIVAGVLYLFIWAVLFFARFVYLCGL